jgi:hypothetical protein
MMLAIGDSYTAGIGSGEQYGLTRCSRSEDAWPIILRDKNDWNDINDGAKPHLNFGACSGDIVKDVREKQLVQGDRPPDPQPQLHANRQATNCSDDDFRQ